MERERKGLCEIRLFVNYKLLILKFLLWDDLLPVIVAVIGWSFPAMSNAVFDNFSRADALSSWLCEVDAVDADLTEESVSGDKLCAIVNFEMDDRTVDFSWNGQLLLLTGFCDWHILGKRLNG